MRTLLLAALLLTGCAETSPGDGGDGGAADAGRPDGARPDGGPDAGGTADAGASADAGADARPCASGLERYSLGAVRPVPMPSALNLPNLLPGTEVVSAGDGAEAGLRLEICRDGGQPTLRSALFRAWSSETPTLYRLDPTITQPTEAVVELPEGVVLERRLPTSATLVEGLAAALEGAPEALHVRLFGESGLVLRGHAGFVALAAGRVDATTITYGSIRVVVGTLARGDVFANLPCPFGESALAARFSLGSAGFDVRACTFLGGGETLGYRIVALTVTDPNAALAPAEQQPITFTGDAAVRAVLSYAWNHHNGCDSFHLALPHADYAATTSPIAGCGTPVPSAPDRAPDGFGDVLYRVRYHGGPWTEGTIPGCHHYLFCGGR
jgi:hypothetical protein